MEAADDGTGGGRDGADVPADPVAGAGAGGGAYDAGGFDFGDLGDIFGSFFGGGFGGVLGMFLGVPVFACIHSAVSFLCESSLRKKGVTDDTIFAPRRVLTGTTTTPKGENHE